MHYRLKERILVLGIDSFLSLVIIFGRIFSLKGFLKSFVLIGIFLIMCFGSYVETRNFSYFSYFNNSYVNVTSAEVVNQPYLKEDALVNFPRIGAKAFLIVDLDSNQILNKKNSDQKFAPASTTKLMTALISQDLYSEDEIVSVPAFCAQTPGMHLGLFANEKISYLDLIHALIISSSNDAACTLANAKVTESEFVSLMNEKSKELSLSETSFTNPVGFDSPNFSHYSTAEDLYQLTLEVKKDPDLRVIFSKKKYTLTSGRILRTIFSTNQLLEEVPGSVGVKTGTTNQAGEVFIYEYDDIYGRGNFMIVLMGSNERFSDTRKILDWIRNNYFIP